MLSTRQWISPTGELRRYLDPQEVWDIMPAEDSYGFRYKGADYQRIIGAKYWLDIDGHLHIDHLSERGRVTKADVRAAIEKALTESRTS